MSHSSFPAGEDAAAGAVEDLGGGLYAIDTMTAGMTKVTAGYLIAAPRPTLVECGPALSIAAVLDGLHALGLGADDLAMLVLSHIHLDHAGGAGDVAAAFPGATIVVSEIGARHLVDPERLNASSRRVYGELMDAVYGDCTPVEARRVRGVRERDVLDMGGGQSLELFATPGHAKHHIGAYDPDRGALFVGDSVGVKMPGMTTIRPATPPPDFDLVLAERSLSRYEQLRPASMYLAHYGAVDPPLEALAEARDRLHAWASAAEHAYEEHDELEHVVQTLGRRFADEMDALDDAEDPDARRRLELLSGVRSNAQGLFRYFQLREQGRVTPE